MKAKKIKKADLPFAVDKRTQYVVRSETSGAAAAWRGNDLDGDWVLEKWTSASVPDWSSSSVIGSPAASWCEAFSRDPELSDFRIVGRREFVVAEPSKLLALLGEAANVPDSDDYDGVKSPGVDDIEGAGLDNFVPGYATVNSHALAFVVGEECVVACLTDWGTPIGDDLAELSWGSEAGMMSGAGSWTLTQTSEECAISMPDGDALESANEVKVLHFEPGAEGEAALIVRWVDDTSMGAFGAAALELEPLDPDRSLSDAARSEWQELIDGLDSDFGETMSMSFNISDEVKRLVRERLMADEVYRDVAGALREPRQGAWLKEALEDEDLSVLIDGKPDASKERSD